MNYKSARSNACDIPIKVKNAVWERDTKSCILCGTKHTAMPNAHYIPRSKGGLGIEENIVTLCQMCHRKLDQTTERKELLEMVKQHLKLWYPECKDTDRIYKIGGQ